mgnify:CR=1 FL=1
MNRSPATPRRRLRNRLMLAFAGFTVLVATVFALYLLLFVYAVEDQLFETMLDREVAAQQAYHRDHGRWTTPRDRFMSVVATTSALPDGIGDVLRAEPRRREVAGADGRHYHLRPLRVPAGQQRLAAVVGGRCSQRARRLLGQSDHQHQVGALVAQRLHRRPA